MLGVWPLDQRLWPVTSARSRTPCARLPLRCKLRLAAPHPGHPESWAAGSRPSDNSSAGTSRITQAPNRQLHRNSIPAERIRVIRALSQSYPRTPWSGGDNHRRPGIRAAGCSRDRQSRDLGPRRRDRCRRRRRSTAVPGRLHGHGAFWNATTRLLDGFKLLSLPETGINIDVVPGPRGPVTFRDLYLRQYLVVPTGTMMRAQGGYRDLG
jgi:hypothetical protein